MGKVVKTDGKGRQTAKKSSHGSYRVKRKPNSPITQRKMRAEAASKFGKDPVFRKEVYGIVDAE